MWWIFIPASIGAFIVITLVFGWLFRSEAADFLRLPGGSEDDDSDRVVAPLMTEIEFEL